ncbi:hypothetical protein B296_00020509 [Ensete ventricosum]|uniref:Retrotransposon gag domain-containing protein n=1 Tax=Ensete ventricosum TaxID=4639 RepID=A0A426XPY2_ENSVE|nr:hypothetical protein B296_00020509 [Ensete ventricosum]
MERHALVPCCTSSVRLGHIPRDDKGKAECTGNLPSHKYKTPTPATSRPKENTLAVRHLRVQLCQVNQRLDEVQMDFVRSEEEVGETTKGGSPFAPKILDKPIPSSFRLPTLEPYDGSTDLTEHVAAFRAQMTLYDTSDTLMCRTFSTTIRGLARMWYNRIKPSSISSFDQFAKEFKLNFITSSCPRPTAASLLDLTQGSDEPLVQFVSRFSTEIRRMPDIHPTLAIQAFLMGLRPSRFFYHCRRRVEVKGTVGVVHRGGAPLGIQRHHRQAHAQQTQGGGLNVPPNHEIPDQSWGRRSPKRPPGIQAVLSDSNYASQETKSLASYPWHPRLKQGVPKARTGGEALEYKKVVARLYNHRVRPWEIRAGDLVLRKAEVSDPTRSRGKLAANWEGPYRVETSPWESTFTLTTMEGNRMLAHFKFMKVLCLVNPERFQ